MNITDHFKFGVWFRSLYHEISLITLNLMFGLEHFPEITALPNITFFCFTRT
jgi:hypothetical protein